MRKLFPILSGAVLGSMLTAAAFLVSAQTQTIVDGPKRSPALYKTLFENDRVRLLEYKLAPGASEPLHSHSCGVVYSMSSAKMKASTADGTVSMSESKAGEARWRNPMAHALENTGATDLHALAFELKGPC